MSDTPVLCAQCREKPGKPKFCSKSCAATFNNRRTPKRRPEGKCTDCGASIPRQKSRCAECAARAGEKRRLESENIHTFRSPAGDIRQLPIQRISVSEVVVFEPRVNRGGMFTREDCCGDFLDALLGVIFAKPAYIQAGDVCRYAAWVDAFRAHVVHLLRDGLCPVTALPLKKLGYALGDWVYSVLRAEDHVLFPTLAIDATRLIAAHAFGETRICHSSSQQWRIVEMVSHTAEDRWRSESRFIDPKLKRDITSQLKGTMTRCVVPAGSRVPGQAGGPPLLSPDDEFLFEIERCHLTHEAFYDQRSVRPEEDDPPRFDIANDFCLRGVVLLDLETNRPIPSFTWDCRKRIVDVPFRWITDVYEWAGTIPTAKPICRWQP